MPVPRLSSQYMHRSLPCAVKGAAPYAQGTVFAQGLQDWFDSVWEQLTE